MTAVRLASTLIPNMMCACMYLFGIRKVISMQQSHKISSCTIHIIIIIIIARPGANTTKYNYQRDNLLMGHVNIVRPTQCVQVEKMHSNTILEELTGT